jgi:hypothetical protein
MEGQTLMPLKCLNCFRMTASRELFDSSVGLATTNARVSWSLQTPRFRLQIGWL